MRIQNRPDLYENRPTTLGAVLIPTGVYPVILADVQSFDSSHGTRLALTFEVIEGAHVGERLTAASFCIPRAAIEALINAQASAVEVCAYLVLARFTDPTGLYSTASVNAVFKYASIN